MPMQPDLAKLHIDPAKLEAVIALDFKDSLAIAMYQAIGLRQIKPLLSLVLTQFFLLGLILIFVLPISLVLIGNAGRLPEEPVAIAHLVLTLVGLSWLLLLAWTGYLWSRARQMKALARLMIEIDKFNDVIRAIDLLDQLKLADSGSGGDHSLPNRQEAIEALQLTQTSLMNALQVEKLLRLHQEMNNHRHEIVVKLEQNLTALMAFEVNNNADDYSRLLNDAVQISLSVHREMRNMKGIF
ncbi:hypothetical protein IQ268_10995 [Oculatella sp. LEGE 06141]|uniref:hypothetical protein n=1 Tax=Oculatella sp. LEGE 06141 TaxID=1828648 RepID=UPI00188310C4|nr:hypothetical protein [Oculatella sp. LEGE 06141]MBE9179088.1 hypothetical protein [Oculatella sp. LEGE 06141]